MTAQFTAEQLDDWRAYEEVRSSGRFNMLMDQLAVAASGLTLHRFLFVRDNYDMLKAAVNKQGDA